jgi:hypothetical protein
MMTHRPDLESHLLRKDLVKTYLRQGVSIPEMLTRLDQNGLFSPTQSYNARYSLVVRLCRSIRKEDSARYRVLRNDAERALVEYIARLEFLYAKAVENGDYKLARDISKDLAHAYGVQTEEPVRVETDMLVEMVDSFPHAEKKLEQWKQQAALSSLIPALDVIPPLVGNGEIMG